MFTILSVYCNQYLHLEFMAYLGWQTYLAMCSWDIPDNDPPEGGIPSDQRTPALVGFLI